MLQQSSLLTTNMDIPSEAEIAELDQNVEETIEPRFLSPSGQGLPGIWQGQPTGVPLSSSAATECPLPHGQGPGLGQSDGASQPDGMAAFVHLTPGQWAAAAMAAEVNFAGVDGFVSDAHQQAAHASAAAVAAAGPTAARVRLDAFQLPQPCNCCCLTTAVVTAATDVATARLDLMHAQNRMPYDREAAVSACCPIGHQHAIAEGSCCIVEPICLRCTPSLPMPC